MSKRESYPERLEALSWEPLELRRLQCDMAMVYRILHGLTNIEPDSLFITQQHSRTRGHPFKLMHIYSRLECRKHSFAIRSVAPWNSLPRKIVESRNVHIFKQRLGESSEPLHQFLKLPVLLPP